MFTAFEVSHELFIDECRGSKLFGQQTSKDSGCKWQFKRTVVTKSRTVCVTRVDMSMIKHV